MLEIELKFAIRDAQQVIDRLTAVGATRGDSVGQVDDYFNHPSRDFAVTDEALRVRTVDGKSIVTYKGPKQAPVGGVTAKTRFELNLPLAEQTAAGWGELLTRLGFRHVTTVKKRRTAYHFERADRRFEIAIDELEGLGLFAEVETLAEAEDRGAAEVAVLALAAELGLVDPEPRSYLEMLLGFRERSG